MAQASGYIYILLILVCGYSNGDIYMHNPRGSNDRCDERSRNRANANRLFDSQNNARGGHNVGSYPGEMYFYAGSQLQIQWANQHSCGDQNNNCNVVIQYMCDSQLRDGTTTDTAPVDCDADCDTNADYGHHESLTYYEKCASRQRNFGLFVADKEADMGDSAQSTRQNNAGDRYGFECPEERDYYPYWFDSPWKDIAVFSRDRCEYYQAESQNVKSRWGCSLPDSYWDIVRGSLLDADEKTDLTLASTQEACENTTFEYDGVEYSGEWVEFPAHGIPAPDCLDEPWSRDNHQGNTVGGEYALYNWTVPDLDEEHCALRIRYNISTNDFDSWTINSSSTYPIVMAEYFSDAEEALKRRYFLHKNPRLAVFGLRRRKNNFRLRIAVDVTQFGRTFQDRSHSFAIKPRPSTIAASAIIYNINVRGKRGNIVQNFPTPEYDFAPVQLRIVSGDYVHFQWTGSDNNPRNNDGQGKAGTDRHNVVQLRHREYAEGVNGNLSWGTNYPPELNSDTHWGLNANSVTRLAFSGDYTSPKDPNPTLDKAEAYFDYGPKAINTAGKYYYFSTRNNAFTNRDQKGCMIVT